MNIVKKIDDLKFGDKEYEKLKRSIKEFFYVEPVIFNERTKIEISEELRQAITASRREKENYERKMRYHCPISIDQLEYQGIEFADPDTLFFLYERKLKEQKTINDFVMNHLTETQSRILMKAKWTFLL